MREPFELALARERAITLSGRMVGGYAAAPEGFAPDEWGDLGAWTDGNARRNLVGLAAEEDVLWQLGDDPPCAP